MSGDPHQKATVLVVDDDDDLRRAVSRILLDEGFEVLEAGSVAEAQEVVDSHRGSIQAALLDIHLPDGWGSSLAPQLRTAHPETAIVFSSGFAADDPVLASGMRGARWHVNKPFTPEELTSTLRRAIEAGPEEE